MNVSTGADLVSSVPSDLFTSATAEDFGDTGDTSVEEAPADIEATEPEAPAEEPAEPADEAEEAVEDAPVEETKPEEKPEQTEELPDGVKRGKDRSGKDGLWLTPQRYETFHGAHKTLQEAAQSWGEPVTPEGLKLRHDAYIAQERMFGDVLSGDPATQAGVIKYFIEEGARALKDGEIGADPTVGLARAMYDTFREAHPDAYATLRMQAAKDLIQELYNEAGTGGNKNLWLSLAHVANALKLPFRKSDEFEAFQAEQTDPVLALQRRNQELEAQLNNRQTTNQAAQFDSWRAGVDQSIAPAILESAIGPALAEAKTAWEKFPEAFQELVVDRLHSQVVKTIKSDEQFSGKGGTIARLMQAAQRATSAQKRAEFGEQIKSAYVNRAKLAVESLKAKTLQDAAGILKGRSDATHERRQAAPNRGPKGSAGPINHTTPASLSNVLGQAGSAFDPASAVKGLAQLLG